MKNKKIVLDINTEIDKTLYDILKRNIIEGYLIPGDRISEDFIKSIYPSSRTMIRETLIKLSKENLVEIVPQKGTYISKINLKNIKDYLFLRKVAEEKVYKLISEEFIEKKFIELKFNLEIQRGLLAIKGNYLKILEMDNEFHRLIFDNANKKNVWDMLKIFQIEYDRLRILSLKEGITQETMLHHHEDILKNLEKKNVRSFSKLLENHIGNFENLYGKIIEKYPNYFID